jgi:hypothetical protein
MKYKVEALSYEKTKGKDVRGHIGTVVYIHPKRHFVTLEFQGKLGKFRESFYPNELMEV